MKDDETGNNVFWRGEIACSEMEMLFGHEPMKAIAWLKEVLYGN